MTSCLIKKAAPPFPASSSSCSSSQLHPSIQTYSPQLNLSLYSPSPSVASSIKSTKKSHSNYHSYSIAPSAASTSSNQSSYTAAAVASTTAAQSSTLTSFNNIKRSMPLYSTAAAASPIVSTIKMDIRSPPQPSQSTSRFMSAFQRFRNASSSSSLTSALSNNNNQKNALYHQNITNSISPAETVPTMKPFASKSSLADKIKNKFHQQLDKKKNRASFIELSTKKKTLSNFSMPRSASLSSMTNWSSRLSGNGDNNSKLTFLKKGINVNNNKMKLPNSASVSSRLSISSSLSLSTSSSSASSSTQDDTSLFMPPEIATSTPTTTNSSVFSLTKSISSHRLYNKSSNEERSSNNNAGSRNSHQAARPRQPLRAVNPNDSVRFIIRQPSPMTSNGNNRKSSPPKQQQQHQQQQQHNQNTIVRFNKLVSVRETFSKADYDRGSDPDAVCTKLTPAMAQQIKEELNAYKLHEMQVHEYSRAHTHFFL